MPIYSGGLNFSFSFVRSWMCHRCVKIIPVDMAISQIHVACAVCPLCNRHVFDGENTARAKMELLIDHGMGKMIWNWATFHIWIWTLCAPAGPALKNETQLQCIYDGW